MFAILSSPTIMMSTQQRFKKFGKDVTDQRKSELSKIGDALKNIADEEKTRAKKLFDDHKKFFTDKNTDMSTTTTKKSIDFYEK
jgi:hemerythrin superfamily protein